MDTPELFTRRFSCRCYRPDPLPRETIEALLEAACWAPTAGALQPWHFVVVQDRVLRKALAGAALQQRFLVQAPVVIVVCAVAEASGRVYGRRGRELYCLQDTAAATENLLLAATSLGLGSCWVGAFDEKEVARALELSAARRPVALVPIGRPGEPPPRDRSRLPLERVTTWR